MPVSSADLENYIERVSARVRDPRVGLFGPGSMVWEINCEVSNILAGGRALLLQTAHPYVAHGVDQHSNTTADPHGRFKRTYQNIAAVVFGDLDAAIRASRRVHALHDTITGKITEAVGRYRPGDAYEANVEPALLWVHATLWESAVFVFEQTVRTLTLAEKDRFWDEGRLFAYMFGISDSTLPPDWTQFMEYCHRMWESDELAVGKPAREIAAWALTPPVPALAPAMWLYKIVTAGLLPPRFRDEFGFRWSAADRTIFRTFMSGVRTLYPLTPKGWRYVPAYVDAQRRIQGLEGRDPLAAYREGILMRLLEARGKREQTAAH
ncbi:MAG: DUF2236 domain-containing protein [Deltaproteobacteria bacterium]|nr:DUF2236 domain-containing protein [Deltaproteobacteria bacterium]